MKRLLILVTSVLLSVAANAQIYKHVDENGNITFTDKPPEDATPVSIGRTNTLPPPDMPKPTAEAEEATATVAELEPPDRYSINIISPMEDAVIPHGPGNFGVNVAVTPDLHETDLIQLFLDGDPVGEPQRQSSWGLTNVSRGTHGLEVRIIDLRGQVKGRSPSVRVHVFRPIKQ